MTLTHRRLFGLLSIILITLLAPHPAGSSAAASIGLDRTMWLSSAAVDRGANEIALDYLSEGPRGEGTSGVGRAISLRNLDLAKSLHATAGRNDLRQVLDLAHQATLGRLGLHRSTPPVPSQNQKKYFVRPAVISLAQELDVQLSSRDYAEIRRLARLPSQLRWNLARIISAFVDLTRATRNWSATEGSWMSETGLVKDPSHIARILMLRSRLLSAIVRLRERVPLARRFGPPLVIAPVLAIDADGEDWTYRKDVALTIDVGGKDIYRNNAGGNNYLSKPNCEPHTDRPVGAGALIDFAGNDRYEDSLDPKKRRLGCAVNGGAFAGGVGILVDAEGDDIYRASVISANGGASGGLGMLVDVTGDDTFIGGAFAANGGSNGAAAGFLLDGGGDDSYSADAYGVNGGGYGGAGTLIDLAGSDSYAALGLGSNGGGYIGSGALFDLAGNDAYRALGYGANGGANVGTGFLFDGAGDDLFETGNRQFPGRFGVNGGAWAGGTGVLVDVSGDDSYVAASLATNGGGGFNGSGLLVDGDGDDSYDAGSFGANGGAALGSSGALLDLGGNDVYTAGSDGANGAGNTGIGLLLDAGGSDSYRDGDGGSGKDKTVAPKGQAGAQVDRS